MAVSEVKRRAYTVWDLVLYLVSLIAVATFMGHFWWPDSVVGQMLWAISAEFAIFSIYSGIIRTAEPRDTIIKKAMANAALLIGCLVVAGLTVSAVWLFLPLLIENPP
jgi:hypothetical protein